jgi:hypothetical protein
MKKYAEHFLARFSIGRMLEGDDELFARRIREGIASGEEMALAADLLQKRTTQRRPKKGQPVWIMNEAIMLMVLHMEASANAQKNPTQDDSAQRSQDFRGIGKTCV